MPGAKETDGDTEGSERGRMRSLHRGAMGEQDHAGCFASMLERLQMGQEGRDVGQEILLFLLQQCSLLPHRPQTAGFMQSDVR